MRCLYCENSIETWNAGEGSWVSCPHCGCRYSYTILGEGILEKYWSDPGRWVLEKGLTDNGLPYVYITDVRHLTARLN